MLTKLPLTLSHKINVQNWKYVPCALNTLQTSLLHFVSMKTASEGRQDMSKLRTSGAIPTLPYMSSCLQKVTLGYHLQNKMRLYMSQAVSGWRHSRNPRSIPGQSMWGLWWTKFYSDKLSFLLSPSHCTNGPYSITYHRRYVILATDRVFK